MKGKAKTGVLSDLIASFLGIADDIALAVIFNEPGLLLGVLPGGSKFNLDFEAKALPRANNLATIYTGKVSYTKSLLWLINITVNLTDRSFGNPVNLSFDKYAGGRYELFRQINGVNFFDDDGNLTQFQADLLNALIVSVNIDFNVEPTFGFISTPSALDVGGGGTTLDDEDYFRIYNAANPPTGDLAIPFNNFITAFENNSANERHISFNNRNGNWLAAELDAVPNNKILFNCSFACGDDLISGLDQFCTGNSTYTVPAGADTYQWSVQIDPVPLTDNPLTGGVIITSATNTNTVTLTHTGNISTWVTLTVVINSMRCDVEDLVLTKRIYVGAPTVNTITVVEDPNGAHNNPYSSTQTCEIPLRLDFDPNYSDVTDIEWEKITTDVAWSRDYIDYPDRYVYLFPECNKVFKFKVRAKNSCGFWSPWRELSYTITSCSSCQTTTSNIVSDNFNLYPVPANTVLNFDVVFNPTWNFPSSSPFINLNDIDDNNGSNTTITYPRVKLYVSFYNSMGNLVHNTLVNGLPNQIDVSNIPSGTYVMTIEYLGQIETHNILIN